MESKKDRAVTSAEATAQNSNRLKRSYHNKPMLSRINRTQRRQLHGVSHKLCDGWFTNLLILTSEQAHVKGNLKFANYYRQLAAMGGKHGPNCTEA